MQFHHFNGIVPLKHNLNLASEIYSDNLNENITKIEFSKDRQKYISSDK